MRHQNHGHVQACAQGLDLGIKALTGGAVYGRKRLVQQQNLWLPRQSPCHRHALLLAARQRRRVATGQIVHVYQRQYPQRLWQARGGSQMPQRCHHVLRGGHVRKQRIRLRHHPHPAGMNRLLHPRRRIRPNHAAHSYLCELWCR